MKRSLWMAAAFACATTVAAAQTPSTTATASRSAADATVTVTGCLQDGSATPGNSTTGAGYILANAMTGSSSTTGSTTGSTTAMPPTSTTAGTTGTTGSTARGMSYVLDGHESELKSHVGHRIEVIGTVEPKSGASSATSTSTAGSAARAMEEAKLKVSSVRMISADCSSK